MDRTQIYLDERETAALDRVASESGRTRSELIREAIAATFLGSPELSREQVVQALELTSGAWSGRGSGEAYVERLRTGRRLKRLHGR